MKYLQVRGTTIISRIEFDRDDSNQHVLNEMQACFHENMLKGDISSNPSHVRELRAEMQLLDPITNAATTSRQLPNCRFAFDSSYVSTLSSCKLPPSSFHRISLGSFDRQYFLFQIPPLKFNSISFKKSRFFVGSTISGLQYKDVASEEEYLRILSQPGGATLKAEYVELTSETAMNCFDVLPLRFGRIFFSERLVKTINRERLTGLRFLDAFATENPNRIYFNQ